MVLIQDRRVWREWKDGSVTMYINTSELRTWEVFITWETIPGRLSWDPSAYHPALLQGDLSQIPKGLEQWDHSCPKGGAPTSTPGPNTNYTQGLLVQPCG